MLKLDEIVDKLKDRNLRIVARVSGLSYDTVWRIANGKTKSVSYMAVEKLSNYLIKGE